jgi:hypothetical protein
MSKQQLSQDLPSEESTDYVGWIKRCFSKVRNAERSSQTTRRSRRRNKARETSESLESRIVLSAINYAVDITNPDYAMNPGGLLDGDVDLTLRIANAGDGTVVLQLVDVDRGNFVVGSAPFTEDIDINITGYSKVIQGKILEFQEALLIDLSNNTGFNPAAVRINVNFDGIKGTLPLIADTITIAPGGGTLYSPTGLNVTLVNGDSITVSGAVQSSGDVNLTSNGEIVVTGSITTSGNITLTAAETLTTNGEADSLDPLAMPSASVSIQGGSLTGQNITLLANATANVTISSATLLGGALNIAEVAVISDADITVDGASSINAAGDLILLASSNVTTLVSRGTQADDDSSNDKDQDAAIAVSVVISNAAVTIGNSASLTAGDDMFVLAQNNVNTTTIADGQNGGSDGGAVLAVSTIEGHTVVTVKDTATIAAVNALTLAALTNRTVTTTAIASPDGATDDGDASTSTKSQQTLANPDNNANTDDRASTSDGDLTLAARLLFIR